MFTTDGPTCSTRSVKSGRVRTCAHTGLTGSTVALAATASSPAVRQERKAWHEKAGTDFRFNSSIVSLVINSGNVGNQAGTCIAAKEIVSK